MRQTVLLFAILAALALGGACSRPDVVIYVALDQVHSQPIIDAFAKETGLTVQADYDQEAVKTIGLVNRLVEEAGNPKCDVFWNNELVHTVRLKKKGLLAPYRSPSAADIPEAFKDPEGYWTGFGARARVFILNTERAKAVEADESKWPTATKDLLDPKWKDAVGMAKPLAGTTLTHMAVLWQQKGPDYVKGFWTNFAANGGRIATGNAHVMKEVAGSTRDSGIAFAYTDTDDYRKAEEEGRPVRMIFPDQDAAGEIAGCLVIPNSVALVKGGRHPEAGKRLIDYILRAETEAALAAGPSAQMPVRTSVPRPAHVVSAEDLVTLPVDWDKVADAVEPVNAWLSEFLATLK